MGPGGPEGGGNGPGMGPMGDRMGPDMGPPVMNGMNSSGDGLEGMKNSPANGPGPGTPREDGPPMGYDIPGYGQENVSNGCLMTNHKVRSKLVNHKLMMMLMLMSSHIVFSLTIREMMKVFWKLSLNCPRIY
jgi:hypothetical protein